MEASTSALCVICDQPSRYKCPRCQIKTCSVECTKKHKSTASCSGQRDKAAYIKPNEYGYGQLMDDYRFLEDIGRFVADKGKLLQENKVVVNGKGKGRAGLQKGHTKLPEWVRHAGEAGIEVVLLREGMERRMHNQSRYVKGTQSLHLTITFALKLPIVQADLVTHNNATSSSLLDLLQKPLLDGRAAKVMNSTQLSAFRALHESPAELVFLLPALANPLEGYRYEPPKEPTPEPEPEPEPEAPPVHQAPNHHSLPARPDFVFGLPPPIVPQPSIQRPMPPQQPQKMTTGLVKRPLTAAFSNTPDLDYSIPSNVEPPPKRVKPTPVPSRKKETPKKAVPKYLLLDPARALLPQLKGQRIIEWPVVEIWTAKECSGRLVAGEIQVVHDQRAEKQEEVVKKAALVDYGSDDEDEDKVVAGLLVA